MTLLDVGGLVGGRDTVGWQADMGHFGLFQISMQGIYFLKIQVFCHTKLASFCSKMFSTPNDRLPKLAT